MVLIYTVVDFIYTDAIKDAISVVGTLALWTYLEIYNDNGFGSPISRGFFWTLNRLKFHEVYTS